MESTTPMRLRNALTALLYGISLSANSEAQAQYDVDIPAGELDWALDSLARQEVRRLVEFTAT